MNVTITPKKLSGEIKAIPSKSHAHRLLICAALADGETVLRMGPGSQDIDATKRCLTALGAKIEKTDGGMHVTPIGTAEENTLLDCGESGSTFRFLLPVAAAKAQKTHFNGSGRLPERPVGELKTVMQAHGAVFSNEKLPFTVTGKLTGGTYTLPGNVSSQYITGLLFALPLLEKDSKIQLTTALESKPYVDMTLDALKMFNIRVVPTADGFIIPGGQKYISPGKIEVEGDWSNAAFFLCAGALGEGIAMRGLNLNASQGDKAILEFLKRFGATVETDENRVRVSPKELTGCEIDVGDTPDLLPVLSIVASCAKGETRLMNASRLRLKESDRLETSALMLKALGAKVTQLPDALIIEGGALFGGTVDSFRDHRIAMSAAVAAVRSTDAVTILGANAADKSYPGFFKDYQQLGGCVHVLDDGK